MGEARRGMNFIANNPPLAPPKVGGEYSKISYIVLFCNHKIINPKMVAFIPLWNVKLKHF